MTPLTFNLRRDVRACLRECMRRHLGQGDRLYDVGCCTSPLADLCRELSVSHVGIDAGDAFYGHGAVDIIGVADSLPLADESADAVLSTQVIEHLPAPESAMAEMRRVLRPGGLVFISFPLVYPLHAAPHDYFRYSAHGFEVMCRRHGLEIVERYEMSGFWYMSSLFAEQYARMFDRSIAKRLHLVSIVLFPLQILLRLFHAVEGAALAGMGKNAAGARGSWTVNYVFVARRKDGV